MKCCCGTIFRKSRFHAFSFCFKQLTSVSCFFIIEATNYTKGTNVFISEYLCHSWLTKDHWFDGPGFCFKQLTEVSCFLLSGLLITRIARMFLLVSIRAIRG